MSCESFVMVCNVQDGRLFICSDLLTHHARTQLNMVLTHTKYWGGRGPLIGARGAHLNALFFFLNRDELQCTTLDGASKTLVSYNFPYRCEINIYETIPSNPITLILNTIKHPINGPLIRKFPTKNNGLLPGRDEIIRHHHFSYNVNVDVCLRRGSDWWDPIFCASKSGTSQWPTPRSPSDAHLGRDRNGKVVEKSLVGK